MTQVKPPDIYDENSVFNRVLDASNTPDKPAHSERLAAVFKEAPTPPETINVIDFLPSY